MKRKTYNLNPSDAFEADLDFLKHSAPWLNPTQRFVLVKYGGMITDARGSMAGNTYSKNRFGKYIRARTKPVNPRSSRQSAARVTMMMLAEQWRESPMTDDFRTAWQTFANSVDSKNKLGETVTLTGFNHFIRFNCAQAMVSTRVQHAGPDELGLPAGDPAFAIRCAADTQKVEVTFDDTMAYYQVVHGFMSLDMGEPQNPTRNYFNGPWRWMGYLSGKLGGGDASPIEKDPPFTLVEGQKVWCRAAIIQHIGRLSNKFYAEPVTVLATFA